MTTWNRTFETRSHPHHFVIVPVVVFLHLQNQIRQTIRRGVPQASQEWRATKGLFDTPQIL